MHNLDQEILDTLKRKRGQKAREIADHLGVDRKTVNSSLYNRLRGKVWQNESYRWYPTESPGGRVEECDNGRQVEAVPTHQHRRPIPPDVDEMGSVGLSKPDVRLSDSFNSTPCADRPERIAQIVEGLKAEWELATRPLQCRVTSRHLVGSVWQVGVFTLDQHRSLSELTEGSGARWFSAPAGLAEVLSVLPEDDVVHLRHVNATPPPEGSKIELIPPDFLGALLCKWCVQEKATRCLQWLDQDPDKARPSSVPLNTSRFPHLRLRQQTSMRLHDRSRAFIWGPPGTGKTTTLACLVAQYLVQYPYSHVLLLSTTNTAVDQLLVVIDRTLDDLGITTDSPEELRRKCKRIGTRFNATMYRGREHLLPVIDESVVSELAAVEAQRPDPRNAEKYNEWRRRIDELRGRLREQYEQELREARLAAMTVASATRYYSLLEQIRFDLAVFDEASQIGMAAALMLAPLGKSTVFAGDPKQIAPIVMSEDERAKDWLGTSIFSKMRENGGETVMLDEQNRMAPPIGQLVSQAFYEGKLRLADDAYSSPEWWNDRQLPDGQRHVEIHRITGEGKSDGHSSFRSNSADLIAKLVKDATSTLDSNDILVITPFRRQRQYIEKRLRKRGIAEVRVQTVHRAQGAEYHTVFFDPVRGASQFLGDENGMRLINVAISRAKARLVVPVSRGDLETNVYIDLLYQINQQMQQA